jgi:hypothetical protein
MRGDQAAGDVRPRLPAVPDAATTARLSDRDHSDVVWLGRGRRTSNQHLPVLERVLLQRLEVGRKSSTRGKWFTSQAATSNSAAMNLAWALMSRPPMFRTCPFLTMPSPRSLSTFVEPSGSRRSQALDRLVVSRSDGPTRRYCSGVSPVATVTSATVLSALAPRQP